MTLLMVALGGCDGPFALSRAELEGDWVYEADNLQSESARCDLTGATLSLLQDGNSFAGQVSGGSLACVVEVGDSTFAVTESIDGAPVTSGQVRGRRITFQIGAGVLTHEGEVDSRSMTGTVTLAGRFIDLDTESPDGEFAAALTTVEE